MSIHSIKAILIAGLGGLWLLLSAAPAQALPSFARQTGLSCAACHTVFPELTTYGRTFKLNGYTTTNTDQLKDGSDDAGYRLELNNTPPIAAMLQVADTFVKTPPGTVTTAISDKYGSVEFPSQLSLFYAGAITPKMGAFVHFTYSSASGSFGVDNSDIRMADRFQIANTDLILGLTLNNNPTVQDVFNTVPAWGFPYATSQTAGSLGINPGASPMIAQIGQEAGGLGVYAFWNQILYAEITMYRSIPQGGVAITNPAIDIQGYAPYWRVALTKDFDKNSIEVGAYGFDLHDYPDGVPLTTSPQDEYSDIGVDAQYQYVDKVNALTLKGTCIFENQTLGYSNINSLTNPTDNLTTLRADLTYYYDRKIGFTVGYFNTTGSSDAALYAPTAVSGYANNVPNTNGMVFEVNYVPWYNTKFTAQYTYYNEFNGAVANYDGSGRFATDNNTLMLMAWLMY
jgi:hypothetical protein